MIARILPDHPYKHMPDVSHATERGRGVKHGVPHQPRVASSDTTLSQYNEANARKLLNDKIMGALAQAIDPGGKFSFEQIEGQDFSPEAVADRILSFVENAIAQAPVGDEAKQRLQQAREGIETGFNEAKDILTNLNVFNGKVEENAEKTYDLLQQGLDLIGQAVDAGEDVLGVHKKLFDAEPSQSLVQNSRELWQEASYSRSDSFELSIKTRDGDNVTIKISREQGASDSVYHGQDASGSVSMSSRSTYASAGFEYSVEGELDDEERQAIDNLLGNVKQLSDKFFNGDAEAAMEHALSLGYDKSEIAKFSLELNQNIERRVTTAYREVSHYRERVADEEREGLGKLLQPVRGFMMDLLNTAGKVEKAGLMDDPVTKVADMLAKISRMNDKFAERIASLEERAHDSLEGVTRQMAEILKPYTAQN